MVWVPNVSDEVLMEPLPPLRLALPNDVPPSRKFTAPVTDVGETVAVKVTACPTGEGFCEDTIDVLVEREVIVSFTALEVEGASFASPL